MKTLRINKTKLEFRRAENIVENFQILKISEMEALTCNCHEFKSWKDVINRYGSANLLREGEKYYGYALVWRRSGAEVNKIYGALHIERNPDSVYWASPVYKEAFKRGALLDSGILMTAVWTFADCCFDERICKKICNALRSSDPVVSLSDDELKEIKEYLGNYYEKFFTEV